MARNRLGFMHFWKHQTEILKRTYILIMFSYWSQSPVSSCVTNLCSWIFWPPCPWFLSPFRNHFLRNIKPLAYMYLPWKSDPAERCHTYWKGRKTTGMIKIPHLVFVPGRSLKLYGVVGQQENNGQTVPPIECIR